MRYVDYVYEIVEKECEGMDSIYRDYIERIVGEYGFKALHDNKYIECCGSINGRELYTLYVVTKPPNYNDIHKRYSELYEIFSAMLNRQKGE